MKKLICILATVALALLLTVSAYAVEPVMPSTGGIGTKIFTVVGIVVMVVAAILLIVRRKVSSD